MVKIPDTWRSSFRIPSLGLVSYRWPFPEMLSGSIPFTNCFVPETILTHWGRVTHICVGNLTIIGSGVLSLGRRQAIIGTNAGILLIGPLGTNFFEILAEIITFSLKKMYLKVSSAKWRPFCLGLNVLRQECCTYDWFLWSLFLFWLRAQSYNDIR